MSRSLPIFIVLILVVGALGVLLFLSLGGNDGTPVATDESGADAGASRDQVDPDRRAGGSGEVGTPTGPAPDRSAGSPRRVLYAGWLGSRPPEHRPLEREAPLEPPPFESVLKPRDELLVRTIRVTGAEPVHMKVWAGTPQGVDFAPKADGDAVVFRLVDPIGGRGPRLLRFVYDSIGSDFVDRFLPDGTGPHTFRIGEPGTITGRITDTTGKPLPGWAWADGKSARSDSNGDFTLEGIRAGQAVVEVEATVTGYTAKRCLLRSPGGPHAIRLDPGVDLKVRLQPLSAQMAQAYVVPGMGSTVPDDYVAESGHPWGIQCGVEETIPGLPRNLVGMLAFVHHRYATRLLRLTPPLTDGVRVTLTRRVLISGEVRDAETTKPLEGEIRVTTSADETTLYDLAVARHLVLRPTDAWRHPVPDLSTKLVDLDLSPRSGKAFEIYADPALRRLGVRVESEGYLPFAKNAIKLDAGPVHLVFKLRPDRPIPRATVVLELPPAPAGGWGGLVIEGSLKRSGRIDRRLGEVHFTDLMPGLYFFKLGDDPKKKPVQVQVETDATVRLEIPDATIKPGASPAAIKRWSGGRREP